MCKEKMKYCAPVAVCILLIVVLLLIPTGYEDAIQYKNAERCTAEVTAVDNSAIVDTGLVRSGEQRCTLVFANGKLIAYGEVVVIEDNFGLRITQIAKKATSQLSRVIGECVQTKEKKCKNSS